MSFGPSGAYLVDVLHSRSAESLAANRSVLYRWNSRLNELINSWLSALRAVLVALAVAVTLPMIDAYGLLATHALCAILLWMSFVYVVVMKKKKKKNQIADNDI